MKTWMKIALGLLIIGIIGLIYVYKYVYNKPHLDVENTKAEFSMKAQDLYNEFKQNKDASGLKYNGKVIEIEGSLKKIEQTDSLTVAVFSYEEGMFGDQGVRCTFLPGQVAKAKSLGEGTIVKLKGYCTGFNDTDIIFEKTSIVN